MSIETSGNISCDEKNFVRIEKTDFIQVSDITDFYKKF